MNGMEAGHSDIDVSIVIVNYRVKYFLEQTVRSAKEALAGFSGEIMTARSSTSVMPLGTVTIGRDYCGRQQFR